MVVTSVSRCDSSSSETTLRLHFHGERGVRDSHGVRAAIGIKHSAPQLPRFLPMAKAAWSESALGEEAAWCTQRGKPPVR